MSAVMTKKTGGQVRSREDHVISGSVDIGTEVFRYSLTPGKWVAVEGPVYEMLKRKFGVQEERYVPDHDANFRNPHVKGETGAMRAEPKPGYILEFKD